MSDKKGVNIVDAWEKALAVLSKANGFGLPEHMRTEKTGVNRRLIDKVESFADYMIWFESETAANVLVSTIADRRNLLAQLTLPDGDGFSEHDPPMSRFFEVLLNRFGDPERVNDVDSRFM